MTLLNLCAGAVRIVDDTWVNLDSLHDVLAPGTPERSNLDVEPNYVNWNIPQDGKLPFADEMFDGIVASHCVEHWDIHQAVNVLKECRRILRPGGVMLVSVPDASVFREKWLEDKPENAVSVFGEPIFEGDGENTFMGYAGFNRHHKVLLSEDSLWCYLVRAGFEFSKIFKFYPRGWLGPNSDCPTRKMLPVLNRIPFSLMMTATK
jgi:predicted SAM-dependent methyltransferase